MAGLLAGIRVLDLSRYLAGPLCAAILADMGAEVIRVENPGGADDRTQGPLTTSGENLRCLILGRNKKGITLDFEKPAGQELFRRLLEKTDIVVENFSPPVKEKLGLGYEQLRQLKPNLILVSISAFGNDGPMSDRLGFDHVIQAETGVMSLTGYPDSPPVRSQLSWVDLTTGVYGALGAAFALLHRNKTGEGQLVEAALLDTAAAYVGYQGIIAEYDVLGLPRKRMGNAGYYAYADTFEALDGTVMVATAGDAIWRRLARLIGRSDLAKDPRFVGDTARYENRHIISELVQDWVGKQPVADVTVAMEKARIPFGLVKHIPDVATHAQIAARKIFKNLTVEGIGEVPHSRLAIRMSKTPGVLERSGPRVGEHNQQVYCDLLGLPEAELAALQAEGVV